VEEEGEIDELEEKSVGDFGWEKGGGTGMKRLSLSTALVCGAILRGILVV
jgi:hypothetical protein